MSQKEIDRLEVMQRLCQREISQMEASHLLKLGTRQVRRLQKAFRRDGAKGLISKRRGNPSSNQLNPGLNEQAGVIKSAANRKGIKGKGC